MWLLAINVEDTAKGKIGTKRIKMMVSTFALKVA
jgi:hypothetical protein